FDMRRMLRKWLEDQVDGQRDDGSLAVISPSPGWGYEELSPAPEWTCLLPVLLDEMVCEYGETDLVTRHAAAAARYSAHALRRPGVDVHAAGAAGRVGVREREDGPRHPARGGRGPVSRP